MRFAICNEVFGPRQTLDDWRGLCQFVASCGYEGIEVAPFTFAENVSEIDAAKRQNIKNIAHDCGLAIVALHWLLVSPQGLHLHSRDEKLRLRTRDYLTALIDFAGDLSAPIMVLGSPRQRHLEDNDFAGAWAAHGRNFSISRATFKSARSDFMSRIAACRPIAILFKLQVKPRAWWAKSIIPTCA